METKNNIFYRPELELERDYSSDGSFVHDTVSEAEEKRKSPNEALLEKAEEIEDKLLRIREALTVLPETVCKILTEINDYLFIDNEIKANEIADIILAEKEMSEAETEDYVKDVSEGGEDAAEYGDSQPYIDEDGFVWQEYEGSGISVTIKKAKSNSEQAKEQYLLDSTELKEEYLIQLEDILSRFVNPLLVYMGETGISKKYYLDLDYDGPEIKKVPKNAAHLHDTIVRNAVVAGEFSLLMQKTHSVYNTLNTFAALDAVSQQRIRYYSENYDNAVNGFLDVYRNDTLLDCRNMYDEKYINCKLNAYKYLSSAVKAADDICQADLAAKSAKCYLLRENIDIYATTKYETETVSNSATKNVAGNGNNDAAGTVNASGSTKKKESAVEKAVGKLEKAVSPTKKSAEKVLKAK